MTYRNDDVIALSSEIVFVKIDGDKDTLLTDQYGVAGYPTIIFANTDGSEIDRIGGYAEPEEFLTIIADYRADRNTLADFLRQIEEKFYINATNIDIIIIEPRIGVASNATFNITVGTFRDDSGVPSECKYSFAGDPRGNFFADTLLNPFDLTSPDNSQHRILNYHHQYPMFLQDLR